MVRAFATGEQLSGVVAEVFGTDRRIVTAARLPNGTKKGVYRLTLDDLGRAHVHVERRRRPRGKRAKGDNDAPG